MVKYFAYGSNLSKSQMTKRVGNWENPEKCVAEGYRLTFDSRGYADIISDRNSKVYGVIYELTEEQMCKLDIH